MLCNGDPVLKAAVRLSGFITRGVDGKYTTPDSARSLGKLLWSSEDQPNSGAGPNRFEGLAYWRPEFWPDSLNSTISKVVSPKLKFGVRLLPTMTFLPARTPG